MNAHKTYQYLDGYSYHYSHCRFTVQITDNLDVFGKNSYIPLIIGLSMIAVGVVFFLLLRLITKNRSAKRECL